MTSASRPGLSPAGPSVDCRALWRPTVESSSDEPRPAEEGLSPTLPHGPAGSRKKSRDLPGSWGSPTATVDHSHCHLPPPPPPATHEHFYSFMKASETHWTPAPSVEES